MAATVLAAFLSPLRRARCANRRRWTAANLILAFALTLPVIFLYRPSLAADTKAVGWTVAQAAGDARYRLSDMPGTPWLSVKAGTFVSLQAQFETGTDGRIVLTREGDRITMSPNSRIVLPDAKPASTVTRVFQSFGIMLYKVRSRAGSVLVGGKHPRRFEVQTPYLVSTVKGTTFSISVTNSGSAVNLIEGILQVSTPDDAVSTQILGGQIASVAANAGNAISVIKIDGTGHKVHHGPPMVEAEARSGEAVRGKTAGVARIASTTRPVTSGSRGKGNDHSAGDRGSSGEHGTHGTKAQAARHDDAGNVVAALSGETPDRTSDASEKRGRVRRAVISSIASHRVRTLTARRIASRSFHGRKGRQSRRVEFIKTVKAKDRGRDRKRENAADKRENAAGKQEKATNGNAGTGTVSSVNTELSAETDSSSAGSDSVSSINTDLSSETDSIDSGSGSLSLINTDLSTETKSIDSGGDSLT